MGAYGKNKEIVSLMRSRHAIRSTRVPLAVHEHSSGSANFAATGPVLARSWTSAWRCEVSLGKQHSGDRRMGHTL